VSLIEVRAVSKTFLIPTVRRSTVREHVFGLLRRRRFRRLAALDDVSFDLRRGETLGILGRNGSGKSTLLKVICGIYPPDRGRVITRAAITPVLELGVGWNPELDAIDNVFLIGSVMGMSLAEIRRSMEEILAFAELEPFANLQLKHYSSGMASRLAYAVAFQAVREVLVLDEVFAVGDASFRERCEARYRSLRARGHAAVLVTHNTALASTFCDRALFLENGRLRAIGPPAHVVAAYENSLFGESRRLVALAAD
jgi:ABC-type polysaccharide/polyol phosphate transport system ATPase subunit